MVLRRRFVVLLAAAVLGGIAAIVVALTGSSPGVSLADAHRLVDSLHTPAGFTRVGCDGGLPEAPAACFHAGPRSIRPSTANLDAVLAAFGARRVNLGLERPCVGRSSQLRVARATTPILTLAECDVDAQVKSQVLLVVETSVVMADRTQTLTTTRSAGPPYGRGTTLNVSDLSVAGPPQ